MVAAPKYLEVVHVPLNGKVLDVYVSLVSDIQLLCGYSIKLNHGVADDPSRLAASLSDVVVTHE